MTKIKVGNVGARTDGKKGLWRVLSIGRTFRGRLRIVVQPINSPEDWDGMYSDNFWCLLDSFEA